MSQADFCIAYSGSFWQDAPDKSDMVCRLLNCRFSWMDHAWLIPCCYIWNEGIVIDYCAEVPSGYVSAFIQQAAALDPHASADALDVLEKANPLHLSFTSSLNLPGGSSCHRVSGSSLSWIPEALLPQGVQPDLQAQAVLNHYQLNADKCWSLHRVAYAWPEDKPAPLSDFSLKLSAAPLEIPGPVFHTPEECSLTFVHPCTHTQHTLSILSLSDEALPTAQQNELVFPAHFCKMRYRIDPPLSETTCILRDTAPSDAPRTTEGSTCAFAASIGIIAGADGPTSVLVRDQDAHVACSSLHHIPVKQITWRLFFYQHCFPDITLNFPV